MEIGWIDFSEKDRKRAIDVLHLLNEGAVDELGIGVVRDAFADYFFPGTSTIMTRAKYFLIIPYAIKEACAKSPSDIRAAYQELEKIEKNMTNIITLFFQKKYIIMNCNHKFISKTRLI